VSQPLGEEVVIEDVSTINQWLKVFRYTLGDFVILFNGDGDDYTYSLTSTASKKCVLTYINHTPLDIPLKNTTLYLSLIKKDLFELVVQKATECGITKIVPIISQHTERKNIDERRLRTISIEASEQSGRYNVPVISETVTLDDVVATFKKENIPVENIFVASLFGTTFKKENVKGENASLSILVGPEGGWSTEEENLFKKENYTLVSLGRTVLRAETAGILCAYLICN
jgi:16S rRNA (uracil1498-N3)-methyltransferase